MLAISAAKLDMAPTQLNHAAESAARDPVITKTMPRTSNRRRANSRSWLGSDLQGRDAPDWSARHNPAALYREEP